MEKKNKQGFTPLQVALEAENVAAVKFLILKGANTKVLNEQTNTEIDLTKQIEALYDKKKEKIYVNEVNSIPFCLSHHLWETKNIR